MKAAKRRAPKPRTFLVHCDVVVKVTIADQNAIERVLQNEDGWLSKYYSAMTCEADVIEHFAFNAVMNHATQANDLDGWADMPKDAVEMAIAECEPDGWDEE